MVWNGATNTQARKVYPGGMLILYLHKSHTSPLLPPKNICIGIVLDFFWDIFMSQEKLQTMIMQNLGGKRGVVWDLCK